LRFTAAARQPNAFTHNHNTASARKPEAAMGPAAVNGASRPPDSADHACCEVGAADPAMDDARASADWFEELERADQQSDASRAGVNHQHAHAHAVVFNDRRRLRASKI
jgi:hypothetical protein